VALVALGALNPVPTRAAAGPKMPPRDTAHVALQSSLSAFSVGLVAHTINPASGVSSTLIAAASQDMTGTGYFIEIFDHTTHTFLKACNTGYWCNVDVTQNGCVAHQYFAYISFLDTNEVPSGVQATSPQDVWVVWGASVSISASLNAPGQLDTVTIKATSCFDVGPTPYFISLYGVESGQLHKYATSGSGFTASDNIGPLLPNRLTTWVAIIDNPAIAISSPLFLTWS